MKDAPRVSMMVPWHRSFVFRFVGVFAATVSLAIIVAVFWLDRTSQDDVRDTFGAQLQAMAGTAAPFVSTADLAAIESNDDASGAEFRRVRLTLDRVRRNNRLEEVREDVSLKGFEAPIACVRLLPKKT